LTEEIKTIIKEINRVKLMLATSLNDLDELMVKLNKLLHQEKE